MCPTKRGNKLGDVCVFFCLWFVWLLWFIIIQKWLIQAAGWIAIFLFSIFGISQILTNYGPLDPLFITEILTTCKKTDGTIFENISFENLGI